MTSNLSVLLKKYAVPAIFIILGLTVLIYGFRTNQDSTFHLSAVFLFIAAILSLMYSSGKFKSSLINTIGIASAVAAGFVLYLSFKSVSDTQEYINNYNVSKATSEQNLSDIRFIQKRHLEVKGRYAATWDELLSFAKVATLDYIDRKGILPSRKMTQSESQYVYKDNRPVDKAMTETEALMLSKWTAVPEDLKDFKIDTIKVNLLKTKFASKTYQDAREIAGVGRFVLEDLPYIPMSGKKMWTLKTIDPTETDKTAKIKVSGKLPFAEVEGSKEKEDIWFGSLEGGDTGGSWEK